MSCFFISISFFYLHPKRDGFFHRETPSLVEYRAVSRGAPLRFNGLDQLRVTIIAGCGAWWERLLDEVQLFRTAAAQQDPAQRVLHDAVEHPTRIPADDAVPLSQIAGRRSHRHGIGVRPEERHVDGLGGGGRAQVSGGGGRAQVSGCGGRAHVSGRGRLRTGGVATRR